jgi:DNA replication protein DnaC
MLKRTRRPICKKCGYELPKNRIEATCPVCRKIVHWKSVAKAEQERLFTKRICTELQSVKIVPNEEDINTLVSGKGLFLHGDVGTGKTLYACAIALEIIRRGFIYPDYPQFHRCQFVRTGNLLQEIKSSFDRQEGQPFTEQILRRYSTIDLLIIDDIGIEQVTEWVLLIFQTVINDRYENVLPTIITSNLGLNELSKKLDARIASRIYEMCEVRDFGKNDYRLKKGE